MAGVMVLQKTSGTNGTNGTTGTAGVSGSSKTSGTKLMVQWNAGKMVLLDLVKGNGQLEQLVKWTSHIWFKWN